MRTGMGKYLRKTTKKQNIPMHVAAVLLCLALFSAYIVSGVCASYATTGQAGGQARVAKFSVTGDGVLSQPIEAALYPGASQKASLNIYNNSEVSVEYTVTATNMTKNLPLCLSISKTGEAPVADGDSVTVSAAHLPGSYTDQYTLSIDWKADQTDPDWMGMVDYIMVTVTAVQID